MKCFALILHQFRIKMQQIIIVIIKKLVKNSFKVE